MANVGDDGYVSRRVGGVNHCSKLDRDSRRCKTWVARRRRTWWLGKKNIRVSLVLPEVLWGKKVRIRVEVVGDDELRRLRKEKVFVGLSNGKFEKTEASDGVRFAREGSSRER